MPSNGQSRFDALVDETERRLAVLPGCLAEQAARASEADGFELTAANSALLAEVSAGRGDSQLQLALLNLLRRWPTSSVAERTAFWIAYISTIHRTTVP